MSSLRFAAALGLLAAFVPGQSAASHEPPAVPVQLRAWFATAPEKRSTPPDAVLSRAEAEAMVPLLFAACRDGARALGWDTLPALHLDQPDLAMQPSELHIGEATMPFVLLTKGKKPATGWPLYLCLHGGGSNPEVSGPHAWDVNDGEWQAQKTLWRRIYPAPGIYFIPRMADDRKGRWYLTTSQIAFEQVITKCLLFRDVDPNRVYMMGISEGGYGAIRFAANRPDRFAATGGMAAAEPLGTSPPENMRNVGMRIDIGEQDTMFDRVGLARRMGERLAELKRDDPKGYDYAVSVQAGRGHGIDYSLTPKWVSERVRNARPDRVVWTVKRFDGQIALQNYWLALPAAPAHLPLHLTATVTPGHLAITAEVPDEAGKNLTPEIAGSVIVRLDDRLLDLDAPIAITVNGSERAPVRASRSLAVMARTLAERLDPEYCFCAEVAIDLGAK